MSDLQVTCINKVNRDSRHEGITHLGGTGWRWTSQDVITMIKDGIHTFYTLVNGKKAIIKVIPGPNGKYLRTEADGTLNDNLLELPECR